MANKPPPRILRPSPPIQGGTSHTPKSFTVKPWLDSGEGVKALIYARSGMGKTTLASMAPNSIFVGLDDGGRKIRNPKTGKPVAAIPGIETFRDLRDALHQPKLFPDGATIVVDTVTQAEVLADSYVLETVKTEKGATATSLESYGWGKGYRHLLEAMRLLLTDLDPHVRAGRNVILLAQLAQARIANAEGTDYLEDGPKLYHSAQSSIRTQYCEWADYVFRIGYQDVNIVKEHKEARAGKVTGNPDRCVFTSGPLHFVAKARPVNGEPLPPVISFASPEDDSTWQFLFPEVK